MKKILAKMSKITLLACSASVFVFGIACAKETKSVPVVYAQSPEIQKRLATYGQNITYFKPYGKYPYTLTFLPGANQFNLVFCGCFDKSIDDVRLVKSAKDIETMVPFRYIQKMLDVNVQIDKKYRGQRESFGAQMLEHFFKLIHLMPNDSYSGTFLVDEYKNNNIMRWSLRNKSELKALEVYMTRNFAGQKYVPTQKVPLFLEMEEGLDNLDADDLAFLGKYFELLDPQDQTVKDFFKAVQTSMGDAIRDSANAKNVQESFGEMAFRKIDGIFSELKGKDLAVAALVAVISFVTVGVLTDVIKDEVKEKIGAPLKHAVFGCPSRHAAA
jgi:hypothetical protein